MHDVQSGGWHLLLTFGLVARRDLLRVRARVAREERERRKMLRLGSVQMTAHS
jgi:hypothetical protein